MAHDVLEFQQGSLHIFDSVNPWLEISRNGYGCHCVSEFFEMFKNAACAEKRKGTM